VAIKVPITRPALGAEEARLAAETVQSGWVTQGPRVAAFEKEFAATVGAPHAVALANCTVALEVALRCLGVQSGDDVVTVSHSFIATANSIFTLGARPVFVDVEPDNYGMDPKALERGITKKTKAILAVHQIGIPFDLEGVLAVGHKHGLPVVEDAACAIGSEVNWNGAWERIGKPHAEIACFSLHPRKIVTTGDGGMVTTANESVAKRIRLLRQHAMSVPDTVRHHSDKVIFEEYTEPAFNYRMTDLQAAIGIPQLQRLDAIVKERRALADRYADALRDNAVFAPPVERKNARSNWQSYPLTIRGGVSQIDAMQFLMDAGIACKRGISNAHQEPAYAGTDRFAVGEGGLAVSERLRDTTVLIPLFHGMTRQEQDLVINACNDLAKRSS